jgi:hypothetical protein
MLGWLQQHLLEIETVGGLHIRALADRHARGAEALRKIVPDPLELAKPEQPWIAGGRGRGLVKAAHRIGGDERIGELALDPRDLLPQRPSRGQLIPTQLRFTEGENALRLDRLLF